MYYDVLPKIKNAVRARKERIALPYSKMDFAVLTALVTAGYVKNIEKEMVGKKQYIAVRLVRQDKKGAFTDFKLKSKPSRHVYVDYRSLHRVMQGHGLAVISTSKGIMTDKEARKNKVGGEYLFEIW